MKEYNFTQSPTVTIARNRPQPRSHRLSKRTRDAIFIICMLAYPLAQFILTWTFVNFGALANAFNGSEEGFSFTWRNFAHIFEDLSRPADSTNGSFWGMNAATIILLNSLGYCFITIFISLPLSLLFSYFLRKNMPLANVFRAIFFLPNIIPIIALTFAFRMSYTDDGYLTGLFEALGINSAKYPDGQLLVYLYCIWAGLGYNIILFSGAIGRIPQELFESAELDHAGRFKEFVHIVIPCIWPTIVTLLVLGMTHVLTLYLQPMLLHTNDNVNLYTISYHIFETSSTPGASAIDLHRATAYGLFFSLIWAPLILLVRHFASKKYSGIGY